MWLGMMYQGAMAKFDIKEKKFTTWSMPPEMQKDQTQVNMVRAEQSHVDGKVWSQNNGFAAIHRLDLKTGHIESLEPFKAAGVGETHNIYDVIPNSKNNAYFTDIAAEYIGKVDKDTMKVTLFQMPKKPAGPAPRHDGRAGPHLVRRIPRQPHRHVRHQDRKVPGMGPADAVVEPL